MTTLHEKQHQVVIHFSRDCRLVRVAAILPEIDANELNSAFASQDFFIFKIGKIGNYANYPGSQICTLLLLRMTLGQPNSDFTLSPPPSDDFF